jgi:hypothetical protein
MRKVVEGVSLTNEKEVAMISGAWTMMHDDWRGTLVINPPDQRFNDGTYTYFKIDGTYTGKSGDQHPISGTLGGRDENIQTGSAVKESDNLVKFQIDFTNGQPPQQFIGYLSSKQDAMAGYTWWAGIPFGWYATPLVLKPPRQVDVSKVQIPT